MDLENSSVKSTGLNISVHDLLDFKAEPKSVQYYRQSAARYLLFLILSFFTGGVLFILCLIRPYWGICIAWSPCTAEDAQIAVIRHETSDIIAQVQVHTKYFAAHTKRIDVIVILILIIHFSSYMFHLNNQQHKVLNDTKQRFLVIEARSQRSGTLKSLFLSLLIF